jgi:hypothetical protein
MKYKALYKLFKEIDTEISCSDFPHAMATDFCGAFCNTELLFELLENPKKCREIMETTLREIKELVENNEIDNPKVIKLISKFNV